jgi:hypothetical protein
MPTRNAPGSRAAEKSTHRLGGLGRDIEMASDRLEQEWALERDAVQFTKDFSLFVLRTCVLLHGGAIVALISLLGTVISHQETNVISVTLIRVGIIIFASGLVVTVLAGMCGYFNFLANQERDASPPRLLENLLLSRRTRIAATTLIVISLVLFVAGVFAVATPL